MNKFALKPYWILRSMLCFPYTSKSIDHHSLYHRKFKTPFGSYLIALDQFAANYAGVVNCCAHDILLSWMKTSAYTAGNELIYLCMLELLHISHTPQIQALGVTSSFNDAVLWNSLDNYISLTWQMWIPEWVICLLSLFTTVTCSIHSL